MALTLGDNFSYQGAKPLDARLKYATVAAMKAMADSTLYDGCLAYCVATDKTYQWKSTNTVDADLGRWREFGGTVDDAISSTSENPVQNKVIKQALDDKADLVDGKIPAAQMPSYVDDVLEYEDLAHFPATGESGKIYIAQDTNKTYRWSGTGYAEISESLALGETSSTAYRGDRGKTAYDISQTVGDVTTLTTTEKSSVVGAINEVKASIPDISGKQDILQFSTMPTASATNEGDIVQYIGATDSTYINGYFYECVSDGQSTPTYSWTAVNVQAAGSSISPYASNPEMDGSASPGASNDYARGDHVHPSDTTRLSTSGDGSNVTAAFTAASSRANITTGEKLSVIFGKIAKFFTDLKAVAFSGSYNDLSNKLTAGNNISISSENVITANASGSLVNNYTTSEQVIGTWIDGKPLYETTVDGTGYTLPNESTVNIATSIRNVDKVIKLEGICHIPGNNAFKNIPHIQDNNTNMFATVQYNTSSNQIQLFARNGNLSVANVVCFVVQYTKTTD